MSPSDPSSSLRAAIVGAGPSGFYAADQLLSAGLAVDLYETLPTPFGLVRAGVAPDHPKIKSVTRVFTRTAAHDRFRFFGAVTLGEHVLRSELLERYHAVVYAIGTATDRRMGIPGEERPGSHSATEFVAWYNGHPHFTNHSFNLDCDRAVVVGNGNVAIDLARMLVLGPSELTSTDTADHALSAFVDAGIREVVILGRRGPAEAAFTNPELRELGKLERADVIVHRRDLDGVAEPEDTTKRRNVELLRDYAELAPSDRSHRVEFRFLRSPIELIGEPDGGPVKGIRVGINRLVTRDGVVRAESTGVEEIIGCGLVLRSIGYRGAPQADIPFDDERGVIRNRGGRVVDDAGNVSPREYVVGWIKRGPSGIIGTNKKDAADTVMRILEDADAGLLSSELVAGQSAASIEEWLTSCAPDHVTWRGWESIDSHELAQGQKAGRPRVKIVSYEELIGQGRR
jgi:ferredoxin--NADP+ reductase